MFTKKSPPLAIKIITVLIIAYSLYLITTALVDLIASPMGEYLTELEQTDPNLTLEWKLQLENSGFEYNENTMFNFMLFGLAILILIELFFIALAIFLWKGRNWSRITLIVVCFVFTFFSFISILSGGITSILNTATYLAIALILLLSKNVKEFYKGKKRKS